MIFWTRLCSVKFGGMVANRSDRRCSSPTGTLVSQFSMYFDETNGVQSMVIGCL
ncbi:MAG: hypothetical protein AW09_001030 [Candidatus Accumulibacter phosphatis]|uniref:Uncharacterized protein n=1 Tax=Candidatus Accumulibacter phosphatis TaxID=327160 RepID=A0A080LY40_9PROT|nr:MAG: hypothetical protein AW09_001030 [Candidatus Accumulibacter phosphatis]